MSDVEHRPGCPATGGYGHGIEPCTCGADPTASIELLPLPRVLRHPDDADVAKFVQHYARANVAHHTEALRAEVVEVREAWDKSRDAVIRYYRRAEQLSEALLRYGVHEQPCLDGDAPWCTCGFEHVREEAALLHDQEEGK